MQNLPTPSPYSDKAVLFYSAVQSKQLPILKQFGIRNILLSYHQIKTKKSEWPIIRDYLREHKGLLMVDSGAFTFKNDTSGKTDWTLQKSYDKYLDEFLNFCYTNSNDIYCTVNMDMDNFVGVDVVDKWNEDLFKPLEKHTNVIYNVDSELNRAGIVDKTGYLRFKEYIKEFDYVGVKRHIAATIGPKIYGLAKQYKKRVHGFAVTSLNILKDAPLFSVDSTTWLGGSKYGTTYMYDGKNFRTIDFKRKFMRKMTKLECQKFGIDYKTLMLDEDPGVTQYNLCAWCGFEKEYLRYANHKLNTNSVVSYARTKS